MEHAGDIALGSAKIAAAVAASTAECASNAVSQHLMFGTPNKSTTPNPESAPIPSPPPIDPSVAAHFRSQSDSKQVKTFKKVPSSRVQRAAGFSSLFLQLGWNKLTGTNNEGTVLSSAGHEMIVSTLSRMRGAVLKLGQMLSIQDENSVPPSVTAIFQKVRDQASAMPVYQLEETLRRELGDNWREKFHDFVETPVAAASIGQVHRATISIQNVVGETVLEDVAVKVQYPGVADSIDSDVANLRMLMNLGILPSGLFVGNILNELKEELSRECQYNLEADKQMRYRSLVASHPQLSRAFNVPAVMPSLSTPRILTTEYVHGVSIDTIASREDVSQDYKNYIAENMMRLTLLELFEWRFMQTDPNFSNFLFDAANSKVHLLDFGASREYDPEFVDDYIEVVAAAAREDKETVIRISQKLGFLTGHEMPAMLEAHAQSVIILGKPFREIGATEPSQNFDFGAVNLPSQIQSHIPTMIKLRLRPPPTPIYSLHRRLSGTILLCTKLRATINCSALFWDIYRAHHQRRKDKQK